MLSSILGDTITWGSFFVCTLCSFALGIAAAMIYMYNSSYTKGFAVTLAVMPSIVQIVIMMVNGNLGTGVAVMGAFSLVRFRSAAGSAKEIGAIFLAMAIGLACGTGYIAAAIVFLIIYAAVIIALNKLPFGKTSNFVKELKVTIPENLDYSGIFDDIFSEFTVQSELVRVKTTNMGSLYELTYRIVLADLSKEKQLIDQIRCRNGNLNITCGRETSCKDEL